MAFTKSRELLRFQGENYFRQRLILATLSGRSCRISEIRSDNQEETGLKGT